MVLRRFSSVVARMAVLAVVGMALTVPVRLASGDETFALSDGDRVVFFGDSITQAGHYVVYVEAYLMTRFPDRRYTVINHGISSETVSGTSEPDHTPRRPDAHDRFSRDITAWSPDVVVACFGMNDGNYHPFDPERFALYRNGVRRLIDRTRNEADARIMFLTPPPYDPYRRQVGDPEAEHYGYRFPAVDYDEVLTRYSVWLRTLRDEGFLVADDHASISEHLRLRRRDRVSFHLAGDGVHPDKTGHWLMAQSLLLEMGAPATVAEAHVDVETSRAERGEVRDVSIGEHNVVSFVWRSPLPMPIDPAWDADSLRLERVSDRLNRYRLRVTGLEPGRYRILSSEGGGEGASLRAVGESTSKELSAGIDLTAMPEFPTVRTAGDVLERLAALRSAQYQAWRASIRGEATDGAPPPPGEDEALMNPLRALCRPQDLIVRIEPIETGDGGDTRR